MGKPSKSFEESLQRLEEIVAELERGELSLEECLARYEEGIRALRHCESFLKKAEERIRKLVEDEKGDVTEERLDLVRTGDGKAMRRAGGGDGPADEESAEEATEKSPGDPGTDEDDEVPF